MLLPPVLQRFLRVIITALLGFLILIVALLLGCQRRLIYFTRSYQGLDLQQTVKTLTPLNYSTAAGRQTAFYVPPRQGDPLRPDRLWIVFGGNGALALGWLDLTSGYPDPRSAFLLVDYPGYGLNQGRPTRGSIIDCGPSALAAQSADPGSVQALLVAGQAPTAGAMRRVADDMRDATMAQ